MDINGATAVVTGGGSGLGAATARQLASKGAKVAVLDLNQEHATTVADEIGGVAVVADVSDEIAVSEALRSATESLGAAPRVVVNCAGIGLAARVVGREGKLSIDVFEKTIRINLIGTYNVMSHTANLMTSLSIPCLSPGRMARLVSQHTLHPRVVLPR